MGQQRNDATLKYSRRSSDYSNIGRFIDYSVRNYLREPVAKVAM
jgi:hypothetical protein